MLRRAFRYHWRLWTLPEMREMLLAAGFDDVRLPCPPHLPFLLMQAVLARSTFDHNMSIRPGTKKCLSLVYAWRSCCNGMSIQPMRMAAARPPPRSADALSSDITSDILMPDHAASSAVLVRQRLPFAVLQVRVWLRPMAEADGPGSGDSSGSGSGSNPGEADFAEYGGATGLDALARLARGWTAFVVGVVGPCRKDSKP